jgi:hypothetical protein
VDGAVLSLTDHESDQLGKLSQANTYMWLSSVMSIIASTNHMLPTGSVSIGVFSLSHGGPNIGSSFDAVSRLFNALSADAANQANRDALLAGFTRRQDEWTLQANLALRELPQVDKHLAAAEIRHQIFQEEKKKHLQEIEDTKAVDEAIRSKFTNRQLFDWLTGQLSTLYFQTYQLTYKQLRRLERTYERELAIKQAGIVGGGAWDSLRRGLLAGERLTLDLKRLEAAYFENHAREYEITKHVSLASLDPLALLELKERGECVVSVPEWLFDLDYPGHYLRRLKTVAITIPSVVGPYESVNCTLTLMHSKMRVAANTRAASLEDDSAAVEAIVTTSGQNDTGLFETNLRDERYLPFEGRGAVGTFHLRADAHVRSAPDAILHLRYTAREGGEAFAREVRDDLRQTLRAASAKPLHRLFSMRQDYAADWQRFLAGGVTALNLELSGRFPALFSGLGTIKVAQERRYFVVKEDLIAELSPGGQTTVALHGSTGEVQVASPSVQLDLDPSPDLVDLLIVAHYSVTPR